LGKHSHKHESGFNFPPLTQDFGAHIFVGNVVVVDVVVVVVVVVVLHFPHNAGQ
jgi:hypothetical protein